MFNMYPMESRLKNSLLGWKSQNVALDFKNIFENMVQNKLYVKKIIIIYTYSSYLKFLILLIRKKQSLKLLIINFGYTMLERDAIKFSNKAIKFSDPMQRGSTVSSYIVSPVCPGTVICSVPGTCLYV